MASITVHKKDGTSEHFPETSCAGGSYHTHIRYEGEFAIIQDAYGKETVFPACNIDKIEVVHPHRW